MRCLIWIFCLLGALCPPLVFALTPEQAGRIAAGDLDDRIQALNAVVAEANTETNTDTALQPFVKALLAETVKTAAGKAYIVADGKTLEAATAAIAAERVSFSPTAMPRTCSTVSAQAAAGNRETTRKAARSRLPPISNEITSSRARPSSCRCLRCTGSTAWP